MTLVHVIWTEYLRYRARLRGFDLQEIETIVTQTQERYRDLSTGRRVAIGRHRGRLVAIPYDLTGDEATPVTVHATTRQQVRFRLDTGRYAFE